MRRLEIGVKRSMHRTTESQGFLHVSDIIPPLTTYEYKGAWARPELTNGCTSVGIVYRRNQLGSLIQVQRTEGRLFETKEQAEQHGLKLCKEWLDKGSSEFNGQQRSKI
jgi:hypothetical protein